MNAVETEPVAEVIVTTSKPEPTHQRKRQPRYAVVVLNDDEHSFDYVILALARIFGYSLERGNDLAQIIDTQGRAIVWTGALEIAELKRDQLRGFGPDVFARHPVTFPLGVELEPVD
ncbi:MAG: ATP-dependent Clp protease adaptor ClpS [Planctomycetaceae bacterium]|nr:ATP-dependent Clp protease adaptor ClpS [Planctomycetaceae bacterium]